MQGIDFITDEKGKKKAVVIDLHDHGKIVEDIIDGIVASRRLKTEKPRRDYSAMRKRLQKAAR